MATDNSEKSKRPKVWLWLIVTSALTFISGLSKALDELPKILDRKYLWIGHFFPDFLLISVVLGVVPWLLARKRLDVVGSIKQIILTQPGFRRYATVSLSLAVLVLAVPLLIAMKPFYTARYHQAQVDWHFIDAKLAMRHRQFDEARRQLERQGDSLHFQEFSNDTVAQIPLMRSEIIHRTKDAVTMIDRFNTRTRSGPLALEDLLLVERAACLDPTAPGLQAAFTRAQGILKAAFSAYLKGVEALQHQQFGQAQLAFGECRRRCRNLLHEEALLRFATSQREENLADEDKATIEYYLHAPISTVERDLRGQPAMAFLLQDVDRRRSLRVPDFFREVSSDRSDRF